MKFISTLAILTATMLCCVVGAGAESAHRDAGYLYLSPVPGAPYTAPQTRFVLVRFANVTPSQVTNLNSGFITVTGAGSGVHAGSTRVASDGRTVIYEMTTDFNQTELVTVSLNPGLAPGTSGILEPFEYQFMVNGPMPGTQSFIAQFAVAPTNSMDSGDSPANESGIVSAQAADNAMIMPNGVSVPSDFPRIVITVNSNPSPGVLFLENGRNIRPGYTMIVDNNGMPLWYRRGWIQDLRIQRNGLITCIPIVGGVGKYTSFDQDFNQIATYDTANGYSTDGHDFLMLEDSTYFIIGARSHPVDMSLYTPGGNKNATARETVIQEFTPDGDLVFQWRAWDHLEIALSGTDFPHMNSIEVDVDGHLLVSSRHLNEVTKIDRDTGEILWRLGGAHSTFEFVNDPLQGPSYQHWAVGLGNGRYLMFDNGNSRVQKISRAVEYQLDLTEKTATLVWEFRDVPDKYTHWMGGAQRLPNGHTLINFVRSSYPKAIEVDQNGVKRFEITLSPNSDHYRAYRFPWNGAVAVPYLIVEPRPDHVLLVFNKFGDRSVDHYRIYGGTSPTPTNLIATSKSTLARITNVANGSVNYFRVTAVSTNGIESDYSNQESLSVNITVPGGNMVANGDFSQGMNGWTWTVTPPAEAAISVDDGHAHFDITSGGIYVSDVQLSREGLALASGNKYAFSFDAWSAAPRILDARVESSNVPATDYSKVPPFMITPVTNHYEFTFTMTEPSDANARVAFNAGAVPHDVFIDNVSVRERLYAPGDFNQDGEVDFEDLKAFTADWQKQGALAADLNGDGTVDFADFVLFSKQWRGGSSNP